MSETIETGDVVGIASEGQGIVRQNGFVTFIPFTAKDDHIEYKITQRKKNFATAKLVHLLDPSPERITPLCQYYGICGGCQLQHIQYAAQVEYKRQWIEDALKKIGKFLNISVPAITPANLQWAYRRRINLVLRPHQNHYQAGYIATDNQSLVAIEACPIFIKEKDPILSGIQEISNQLESPDSFDGKVTILKSNQRYIIHFHFRNMPTNASEILSNSLKNYPFIQGILASSQKKSLEFGNSETTCEIAGLSFKFTPNTFIQNHPEQSLNIYNTIVRIAKDLKPKNILDLYCGIGISSVLLAQLGCTVIGVELNPQSIELAKANAKHNHLNQTQFIIADVEKILAELLEKEPPDLILVNPPREGLSSVITQILASKPSKNLLYISCMPSTLARDLKSLCDKSYRLISVQAFDMFPQTIHVETVVLLQRL